MLVINLNAKVAKIKPAGLPNCANEAKKARRPVGACSPAINTAPPHSPPTAKPCTKRNTINKMGATMPACSNVGNKPMQTVEMPIKNKVIISDFLRPILSPMWPKNMPPMGRMNKPIANVANDAMVPINALSVLKNNCPKIKAEAKA